MKNKKLLFFVILLFPALFKIILEFTTVNSSKLPYYGPKLAAGTDTVYYKVTDQFKKLDLSDSTLSGLQLNTANYPLFAVCFIKSTYKKDNYRLSGLSEYAQYKKDKIKLIPFVIVTPYSGSTDSSGFGALSQLQEGNRDILPLCWPESSFDSLNLSFFKAKPVHIDYSFFVLVDRDRHIRGYYDARYVSEIKRLIEEYQHMRLKEEKEKVMKINEIKSK